jgi:DNA repair protein RadC
MDNFNKVTAGIKNWSVEERPREKMTAKGTSALTDAELIAILINNGSKNKTAVDLARELLQLGKNNLIELGKLTQKQLQQVKGIGPAKAITITAALELGRRFTSANFLQKPKISSYKDIVQFVQPLMRDYTHEVLGLVCLNNNSNITDFCIVSQGGLAATIVDARIIYKKALEQNAVAIAICHNHPSGSLQPSDADIKATQRLLAAGKVLQIQLIDHIIISEQGYFSFANNGML